MFPEASTPEPEPAPAPKHGPEPGPGTGGGLGDELERTPARQVEIMIPRVTFIRVFAALLIGYGVYVLWPLLLLVFLALFLAVTLNSCVVWLEGRGLRRWLSLTVVIGGMLVSLTACVAWLLPPLFQQVINLGSTLPALRDSILNRLPAGGMIRESIEHLLQNENWAEAGNWLGHFLSLGGAALNGLSQLLLMIVIAVYLLIDGGKAADWLLAFFAPSTRGKLRVTSGEISKVIFGYVIGQVITSLLVAIFAFAVLSLLHVPGALMLAIVAGILDILPVLGFILSTVPAFLLALSVSPSTAFLVLALFVVFHGVEVYFIIPKVYGQSLRLSTLTVLLGLLAGTLLAGIPGALAALPVIASYAAIERIWLKPYLRDGVSEKHELQKDREFGEKAG